MIQTSEANSQTLDTLRTKAQRIRFSEHQDGGVILDPVGGLIYVCNHTAALIWRLIVLDGCSRNRAAELLVDSFKITHETALNDIDSLIEGALNGLRV